MVKTFLTIAAVCGFAITTGAQERPANSITDVTGTWVISIESHQLGLELEQKESKIEGVLHAMGQRILLAGTYEDRKLMLKGERSEDETQPAPGAGPISATMLDDGTMAGELSTNHGRMKFTAERLRKP